LQRENPYPCLNLLEAAVVCCRRAKDKTIPAALLTDLAVFGRETAEAEAENLAGLGVLIRTEQGLLLNSQALPAVSALLNQLKKISNYPLATERKLPKGLCLNWYPICKKQFPG
jgi:hypothetical protein